MVILVVNICFNRMHQWVFRFLFCILAYVLINSIIKVCIRNTLTLKFWEKKIGCSPSFSLSKKFAQINDPTMATYDPHFYHIICFSWTNVDVWKQPELIYQSIYFQLSIWKYYRLRHGLVTRHHLGYHHCLCNTWT